MTHETKFTIDDVETAIELCRSVFDPLDADAGSEAMKAWRAANGYSEARAQLINLSLDVELVWKEFEKIASDEFLWDIEFMPMIVDEINWESCSLSKHHAGIAYHIFARLKAHKNKQKQA